MMDAFPAGFLAGLAAAMLCQGILPLGRQLPSVDHDPSDSAKPLPVGMGLWAGLVLATGVMAIFQSGLAIPEQAALGAGRSIAWVALAALPAIALGAISDFGRQRSERHALGLAGTGIILTLVGFSVFSVSSPLGGTVYLGGLLSALLTLLWLFLLVSIVELSSLVPLGMAVLGVALPLVVVMIGGPQQSAASYALAGITAGAVIGRLLADLAQGRPAPYGKAEVFALGIWLTAMLNVAFLKSVVLVGFVLPLAVLASGIIVLSIRAFERSLLLRDTPRRRS